MILQIESLLCQSLLNLSVIFYHLSKFHINFLILLLDLRPLSLLFHQLRLYLLPSDGLPREGSDLLLALLWYQQTLYFCCVQFQKPLNLTLVAVVAVVPPDVQRLERWVCQQNGREQLHSLITNPSVKEVKIGQSAVLR